jgi:hypothetical protein
MQSGVCLSVEVENAKLVIMFWLANLLRVMLRVENSTLTITSTAIRREWFI